MFSGQMAQEFRMTRARRELISLESTPYYHCVSRCVRRAFLCGDDRYSKQNFDHRRQWIFNRLKQLADVFAIKIAAFAIMSNHYHVIVRIDQDQAMRWSNEDIIERWYKLFNGAAIVDRWRSGEVLSKAEEMVVSSMIETWRQRLYDLGWFMRCLNEHIARLANQEDGCKGRFWEGRYKSQALLDERALLTCMTYVDLNPIRANMSKTPETSDFTSIQERIRAFSQAYRKPNKASKSKLSHLIDFGGDESLRKTKNTIAFHLDDYIALVDWSGRTIRDDKRSSIPKNLPPIFKRLNMAPEDWLKAVKSASHRYGLARGPIARLKLYAERLGKRWIRGQSYCKVFYQFAPD
jgi:REP element-mobilizing transposase RayT